MDVTYMGKVFLPVTYTLSDTDVICGRGRTCFYHAGNIRFREIVLSRLPNYLNAKTKTDKTIVIYDIVNYIRQTSTTQGGGFVKLDKKTGRYFEVGDFLAREKTSQAFRDILHEQYKSSNANKRSIRKSIKDNKVGGDNKNKNTCNTTVSDEIHHYDDEILSRDTPTLISRSSNDSVGNYSAAANGSDISAYAWKQQPNTVIESNPPCSSCTQSRTIKVNEFYISCPELSLSQALDAPSISSVRYNVDPMLCAESQGHLPLQNIKNSPESCFVNTCQIPMLDYQMQTQTHQQQHTNMCLASRSFNNHCSISSSFVRVDEIMPADNSVSGIPSIDISHKASQQTAATFGDCIRSGFFDHDSATQMMEFLELLSCLRQSE